jgi:hypothetical protein
MMTRTRLIGFAVALLLAPVGCGSDSSGTDGGVTVGDGGGLGSDSGSLVDANQLKLSAGKYKVTAINPNPPTQDECMIGPQGLVGDEMPADWINVEIDAADNLKIGNPKGDEAMPASLMPSLGSGMLNRYGTTTLKRTNHVKVTGTPCEYDSDVTSTVTLDANDSFGLGVVEKQTNRTMCAAPAGVPASCTSVWTWRLVKGQ